MLRMPLAGQQNQKRFKTNTHQGAGFNELTFEDQKDQQIDILNDCKFVIKGPGGSGGRRCQP